MDDLTRFGVGTGVGGLGAGVGALLFGNNNDPYGDAAKYFNQIPGKTSPYFNPYINAGLNSLPTLTGQFNNLINDPAGVMNKVGAGYQESPGYQFQLKQGLNAANNAAAAGGMLGTPANQYNAASFATGLANQDYYNYLNHALGQYQLGVNGLNNINNMGYNASDTLAGIIGNSLMNQGNLAFSSAAAKNQAEGSEWGDIMGGIGTLAAFL